MTTATNNRTQTNIKLFVAFLLLVLSSTGVFAQANNTTVVAPTTSTEVTVSKDATIVIAKESAVAASMDFAVWFMGSKKTTNTTSNNGSFSKKQLINSGINTNSVLIRSFLKKISTQENGIA